MTEESAYYRGETSTPNLSEPDPDVDLRSRRCTAECPMPNYGSGYYDHFQATLVETTAEGELYKCPNCSVFFFYYFEKTTFDNQGNEYEGHLDYGTF